MSWGVGSDGHECIMGDGSGGCVSWGWEVMDMSVSWEMEVVDVSVMGDGKRWT